MEDTTKEPTNNTISEMSLEAWRARAVSLLLTTASIVGGVAIVPAVILGLKPPVQWVAVTTLIILYLIIIAMAIFRRIDLQIRTSSIFIAGYMASILTMGKNGLTGVGPLYLLGLPVLGIVLLGTRFGIITSIFSVLIFSFFTVMVHLGWLENWLISTESPIQLLTWIGYGTTFTMLLATLITVLRLFAQFQTRSLQTSKEREKELNKAQILLKERIEEAERRARQFEAITNVGRKTTELLGPKEMLQQAVNAIKEQFDFQKAAIYLIEKEIPTILNPEIRLEALAGGNLEKESYPKLQSTAQRVLQEGPVTAVYSPVKDKAPPKQLGIPLRARGEILGVLVIQTEETSLHEENVEILQILADQITTAHDNARLFAESEASLQRMNALYRQYATKAWQEYLQTHPEDITYSQGKVTKASDTWQKAQRRAQQSEELVSIIQETPKGEKIHSLAVPITLRGLPLGVVGFHRPITEGPWQKDEMNTARAITERLVLALENIRLLEDTQRRAAQERLTSDITSRMRETLDVETVLQTAIQEIGQTLNISKIKLRMSKDANEATSKTLSS